MVTSVALDERLISVALSIGGQIKTFDQRYAITSTGTKFANPLQNECSVKIANLTTADRDYLLSATSPFNKNPLPKSITLSVGRVSTGLSQIYTGNINTCEPTGPADVFLEFKCVTGQQMKGKLVNTSAPAQSTLSNIAKLIAADNELNLNFQATDKNIANYSHSGSALGQIGKLNKLGAVQAYQDDGQLVVKNLHVPLSGQLQTLDLNSGMVGVPKTTEFGLEVQYLIDKVAVLGGALQVNSVVYPTVNGQYVIFKLGWDIASRELPFYWKASCYRLDAQGDVVIPNTVPKQKKGRKRK